MSDYKNWISEIIIETGATKASIAAAIGVGSVTLSRWLHDQSRPSGKHIDVITAILHNPQDYPLYTRRGAVPQGENPWVRVIGHLLETMTPAQLVAITGTCPSTVSKWRHGTHRPRQKHRKIIKKLLTEAP